MTITNRFALMLEALTELAAEEQTHPTPPISALPDLQKVLADIAPLPRQALFLGLAEDGLPILLKLSDPVTGPLLIAGDSTRGMTAFLRVVAHAVDLTHSPADVKYGVITSHPDEWSVFQDRPNSAGIHSTTHAKDPQEFLHSLVEWAHNNKGQRQSILLLVDDLEAATRLSQESEQDLRWLLLRGPSRRVWPIAALQSSRAISMEMWLGFFRTRLFGTVRKSPEAQLLTGLSDARLEDLSPESHFTMREGNDWLNFWIPRLEQVPHGGNLQGTA
jgi:hypothetical protein